MIAEDKPGNKQARLRSRFTVKRTEPTEYNTGLNQRLGYELCGAVPPLVSSCNYERRTARRGRTRVGDKGRAGRQDFRLKPSPKPRQTPRQPHRHACLCDTLAPGVGVTFAEESRLQHLPTSKQAPANGLSHSHFVAASTCTALLPANNTNKKTPRTTGQQRNTWHHHVFTPSY